MFIIFKLKKIFIFLICMILLTTIFTIIILDIKINTSMAAAAGEKEGYIKWVDFDVTYSAMEKALNLDINSHNTDGYQYNWIEILAYLGAKYGGTFSKYKEKDIDNFAKQLTDGKTIEQLTQNMKYYNYYLESYTAILGGFVGNYSIQVPNESGTLEWQKKYGLKVFSPIALGYPYSEYNDFGSGRDYGFSRKHLGHDLMASTGTPVIAIESGIVEELGWNQYGGWRIGIRSFDQKRYYYYAHLRKDYPYNKDLVKGSIIKAGDVIGYVGRTGYSLTENTNNIKQSHLHFGMQLIFDESQKDSVNEIWIDLYALSRLLQKNKSKVQKIEGSKEYKRVYDFSESSLEDKNT